jgi:hypothetical protein
MPCIVFYLITVSYCIYTYLFNTINNLNIVIFFISWTNSHPSNNSLHTFAWNDVANLVSHSYTSTNCVSVIVCMHVFEFYVSHFEVVVQRCHAFPTPECGSVKTLPRAPRIVYPQILSGWGYPRWTFLPICVWLGHSNMPKQCARATCISPRHPEAPEAPFHQNPSPCVPCRLPP